MFLPHFANLWHRHSLNVRLAGILARVVLVVILRWKKCGQRLQRRRDWPREVLRFVQLADSGFGDPLLIVSGIEDGRAILGANIIALAVELGGVVGVEEDVQKLVVADS